MSETPKGSVGRGVAIAMALHVLQIAIIPAATFLFPQDPKKYEFAELAGSIAAIFAWSVTQFLYLGPAAWIARRKGQTETAKGILITAGVGVLLNGACDASLFIR